MYYCHECGERFKYPAQYLEPHSECGVGVYERFSVCPDCGGNDIDEVTWCILCGEDTEGEQLCEECQERMTAKLARVLNEGFSKLERKALWSMVELPLTYDEGSYD